MDPKKTPWVKIGRFLSWHVFSHGVDKVGKIIQTSKLRQGFPLRFMISHGSLFEVLTFLNISRRWDNLQNWHSCSRQTVKCPCTSYFQQALRIINWKTIDNRSPLSSGGLSNMELPICVCIWIWIYVNVCACIRMMCVCVYVYVYDSMSMCGRMCRCMCMCNYVYVYVRVYVCVCICAWVCVCVCESVSLYAHTCIYAYPYTCISVHVNGSAHVCTCMCVYLYILYIMDLWEFPT